MNGEKETTDDTVKRGAVRKSPYVTIEEKIEAVNRLNNGEDIRKICSELGVHGKTINRWKNKEKEMLEFLVNPHQKYAKIVRVGHNPLLEDALKIWFDECRKHGIPLSGPLIQAKALVFNKKLGGSDKFRASEGWLSGWKTRYEIKSFTVREKLPDAQDDEEFKMKFAELVQNEDLSPSQVFNYGGTGLDYKMLPEETSDAEENRGIPHKLNKERNAVVTRKNADGSSKLPLLVIGKSRALKNSPESLPVICTRKRKRRG